MNLTPEMRDQICIRRSLFDRLMVAGGTLEAGMIANMNTMRLSPEPKLHVRILGESKTLCGKRWMPQGWQFTSRGSFGEHAPHGTRDYEWKVCRGCRKSQALALTIEAEDARVAVLKGGRR